MTRKAVVLGTRGSGLALWQAHWVSDRLREAWPDLNVTIEEVRTLGDVRQSEPLSRLGGAGVFTREIEQALLQGQVDVAVHSLKDLPAVNPPGLILAAITQREKPHDVLISRQGLGLMELPPNAAVATGSLRRKALLLSLRPDLQAVGLRGNLQTRFRKFHEQGWDGMILAYAGVARAGYSQEISQMLPLDRWLPAPGQGSIGLQTREEDQEAQEMLRPLNHIPSALAATAERALLRHLEGGCQVPIGGLAIIKEGALVLHGLIADEEGHRIIQDDLTGETTMERARDLGYELAQILLSRGGGDILNEIRHRRTT